MHLIEQTAFINHWQLANQLHQTILLLKVSVLAGCTTVTGYSDPDSITGILPKH